mmetsp:Transcript_22735/g.53052  ORF Transcript_22735/g.53052 Transcript_22735/m.53052 type:complete len:165 (+) Transcript_22735:123-617(+)|eukprot:CAMPEP_0178431110 /NCGR_PEP_ID=MMETSP0689_2-20121128/31669_1 /TAXON_ID=160604 /ORGANISM="Amphidinium massartii, Strain CS-259" /LENGTH=164 /DNA_ID=CAMNT_0020052993 /DNA_START=118 /DNA_END=612 /DNA_ORIENTATION=-
MSHHAVAWKERPRKFGDPMLNTTHEVSRFKDRVKKELAIGHAAADRTLALVGHHHLKRNNSYFSYFKDHEAPTGVKEHKFTFDQTKDSTPYTPDHPRDTMHPMHTEAMRRRCKVSLQTTKQVRTSQAYGWRAPYDDPKMGFGIVSFFSTDASDKSHLESGKPVG